MTEHEDDYGIDKPIDDDYIDVTRRRADISHDEEDAENDNLDRSPPSTEHVDMSHIFDDGSGAGASSDIDELIDDNAVIEHDGRARTRTFYYPDEAPERSQRRFSRMLRWQEGEGAPERDIRNNEADLRRWVSTFCKRLGFGDYQTSRVEYIAEKINMKHMAHYSTEEVILGIITIVANEDNRFIRDEQAFKDLVEDLGSDMYTIKRVRGLVRTKSDEI